ncbi:lipoprotein [Candidatus Woesearchaeota archaeon]|nr:lipoprotein [Candidatus Woesearchaeota archaeon]
MKSYVLALVLIIILFVAGCGQKGIQQETAQQTAQETASPILDNATNVEAVQENLSPADSTEDDYGDII